MFQLFALALPRMPGSEQRGDALHSARLAATLLYMGIGPHDLIKAPLVPFFTWSDASVVDAAGHVWLIHHIKGVSAPLGFCTMGLVSAAALSKLRRSFH